MMFPDGDWKYVMCSGPAAAACVQRPGANRRPFQRQTRACVPPLGKPRPSPVRKIGRVSLMPPPTAPRGAARNTPGCFRTRCQERPVKRKTAHPCRGQQVGAVNVTAIALLPEPVNAPQSTWAIGVDTSVPQMNNGSATCRAVAFEQVPTAAGLTLG